MAINISKYQSVDKQKKKSKPSLLDFMNQDIQLFGTKWNDRKKEQFYSSMYTLLNSGIDLASVLKTLQEEHEKVKDRKVIDILLDKIVEGNTLSESLRKSSFFTPYEYFSVQIGEETGALAEVLKELKNYYSVKIEQQRKLVSALMYPVIVLVVAFVAVFFMLNFIVPIFADVFQRFGGELPWITKQVLLLSGFFKSNWLYGLLLLILIMVFWITQRKKAYFNKHVDLFLKRLPFLGNLIVKLNLSRFARSLSLMIKAKVPLTNSLELLTKMISFYPVSIACEQLRLGLLKGESLVESMQQNPLFPPRMRSMVKVGEEVNQLNEMFEKVADEYADEVSYKLQLFNSILEPLLIIFLALVVGIILISMYLPIFKLSTEIM